MIINFRLISIIMTYKNWLILSIEINELCWLFRIYFITLNIQNCLIFNFHIFHAKIFGVKFQIEKKVNFLSENYSVKTADFRQMERWWKTQIPENLYFKIFCPQYEQMNKSNDRGFRQWKSNSGLNKGLQDHQWCRWN